MMEGAHRNAVASVEDPQEHRSHNFGISYGVSQESVGRDGNARRGHRSLLLISLFVLNFEANKADRSESVVGWRS